MSQLLDVGLSLLGHEGTWVLTDGVDHVDKLLQWGPCIVGGLLKVQWEVVAIGNWKRAASHGGVIALSLIGVESGAGLTAARCPCWVGVAVRTSPLGVVPHEGVALTLNSWSAVEVVAGLLSAVVSRASLAAALGPPWVGVAVAALPLDAVPHERWARLIAVLLDAWSALTEIVARSVKRSAWSASSVATDSPSWVSWSHPSPGLIVP